MKQATLVTGSRKLVGAFAVLMLALGFLLIAQGFIDTKNYRVEVQRVIKERTGQDVLIKGKVAARLLPRPSLYVPSIELHNEDNKNAAPTFTAHGVYINAAVLSLFSGDLKISSVTLDSPVLEIRRSENGVINWDWLGNSLMDSISESEKNPPVDIDIVDGSVFFYNDVNNQSIAVKSIHASGSIGGRPELSGSMNVSGRDLSFTVDTREGNAPAAGWMPLNMRIGSGAKDEMKLSGGIKNTNGKINIEAELGVEVANLHQWILWADAEKAAGDDTGSAPLKLAAKWKQDGWKIDLSNLTLDGLDSSATGKAEFEWAEVPTLKIDIAFNELQYTPWRALVLRIAESMHIGVVRNYNESDERYQTILPDDISITLNATAEKLLVSDQSWEQAKLSATLEEAAITINQFYIDLPDAATLTLFGLISEGGSQSLRFEGNMETQGKSLRNLLTLFDVSAKELPQTGFGEFYIQSNIFMSPEQVRLSEADVKINDLRLSGGMVAYFDSKPRVEADVRLRDINFDYFRDVWRENQRTEVKKDFFMRFNKNLNFSWLKRLKTNIDFKVIVEEFTFLERKGESAAFRLFAQEGELGIYNMRFYYPDDIIEASFNLNVNAEVPMMTLLFNTSKEVNTDYFISKGSSDSSGSDIKAIPVNKTDAAEEVGRDITIMPQAQVETVPAEGEVMVVAAPPPPPPPPPPIQGEEPDVADEEVITVDEEAVSGDNAAEADVGTGKGERWSTELFDMSWMGGYNASFDISIGKLIHNNKAFHRLKLRAHLRDTTMTIQTMTFGFWQGRCDVTGTLYGGRVPGISIGFTLSNADLEQIVKSFSKRGNITGKLGMSGTLSTSGVNPVSWVSQAEAKLVLNGVGVNVGNFNLQGVMDVVNVSRTTADVVNNVNLVLPKGSTEFSMEGYLNIRNGAIRTPGITLKSGSVTGNLTGELKLIPWTMSLSTLFQFPAMTSETIPTMNVKLTGPVDKPDMRTDTDSLEAYVSKRIVGQ